MSISHIDLRRLRYVSALARTGSYTAAAAELGVTQSALTRSVQTLEERYSVKLFDRGRGGLRPTQVGRELLLRAQDLLTEAEDLGRYLDQAGRGEVGEVHFGLGPMLATFFLPKIISEYLSAASEVRFSVSVRGASDLIELLAQDRIEFYIAADSQRPKKPEVKARTIGEATVSLVVRKGHPILQCHAATADEIAKYPVISSHRTAETDAAAQVYDRSPALQFQIDDTNALLTVTRNTDAILMTTAPIAAQEITDMGLVVVDIPSAGQQPRIKIVAVTRASSALSPAASELLARFEHGLAQI